jgi:hypothetical protein
MEEDRKSSQLIFSLNEESLIMVESAAVNFWIYGHKGQFAFRRLFHVPREGEVCVFSEKRYVVLSVEWCLDEAATEIGVRVNIELGEVQG